MLIGGLPSWFRGEGWKIETGEGNGLTREVQKGERRPASVWGKGDTMHPSLG